MFRNETLKVIDVWQYVHLCWICAFTLEANNDLLKDTKVINWFLAGFDIEERRKK